MADTSLVFRILAKDYASEKFGSVGKHADDLEKKLGVANKGISRTALLAGTALAGGAVLAGRALFNMAKGAAQDQKSAQALAGTLKNSVKGATDATVASMESWISAQGQATGISDDKMRPALERLVRSTGDVGKAQGLMSTAMNISAATGKDVGTVAEALAKANDGQATSLQRLGVNTKDANGKALAFKEIQKRLDSQFKGQSAAAAETLSGKTQRLSLMWSEFQESIGYKVIPIMSALMGFVLNTAIPALSSFAGWVGRNKGILLTLAGVVVGLTLVTQAYSATLAVQAAGGLAAYIKQIGIVSKVTKVWTAMQWLFNAALTANPIGIAIVAIAALVAGIVIAYKKSETFRNIVQGALRGVTTAFGWVIDRGKDLWNWIKELPGKAKSALGTLKDILTAPWRLAFSLIAKLWNNTVGRISFTVPSWVPGIGGNGFSLPQIPETIPGLRRGGTTLTAGVVRVGEAGPELLHLPAGATVAPLNRRGGGVVVQVSVHVASALASKREIADAVVDSLADARLSGRLPAWLAAG